MPWGAAAPWTLPRILLSHGDVNANSASVTFGVVAPFYGANAELMKLYPFDRFSRSIGQDFVERITARGFATTGPYPTQNDMTYGEREIHPTEPAAAARAQS